VLYMAFIFGLSSVSLPPRLAPDLSDKLEHVALYFGLGVLLVRALAGGWSRRVTLRLAATAALVGSLYGMTDELHQYFVPMRELDLFDVVADAAGSVLASGVLFAWGIIRGRNGL
jgi:VanZ family protein